MFRIRDRRLHVYFHDNRTLGRSSQTRLLGEACRRDGKARRNGFALGQIFGSTRELFDTYHRAVLIKRR